MSCQQGCCLGNNCVPLNQQGNSSCGFFGLQCSACAPNETCGSGKCQPVIELDAGTLSPIGDTCVTDSNCGNDGLSFCIPEFSGGQPTGFVGGYCSRTCENTMCPLNSACVEAATSGGDTIFLCLAECFSSTCRMGYQCEQTGNGGVCLPQ